MNLTGNHVRTDMQGAAPLLAAKALSPRTRTTCSCVLATSCFLVAMLLASGAAVHAQTPIKVMTYNTHHGGTANSPATTDGELDTIAAQNPDVVVLQEAYSSQLNYYVDGLNKRLGTSAWHGSYAKHCKVGAEPTCTTYSSEVVMLLTRLETVAVTPRLVWAKDDYFAARAALRMNVALENGSQVNVFSLHLPALSAWRTSRNTYVNAITAWAQTFDGPKVLGGDFNDSPSATPILAMSKEFSDAWMLGGSGSGYTHAKSMTLTSRIDYWFSDKASGMPLNKVAVVGNLVHSDHLAVVATYAVPAPVPTETTLMRDGFETADAQHWTMQVITGTQDTTIPVTVAGGRLRTGDLKPSTTGIHYNGISSSAYDLSSNGGASVQLVTPPNLASTAYAMFSVVRDTNNMYRWYESGGVLIVEKKIGGTKTTLANLQYDANMHQFLRIRKVANAATGTDDVVFETAPNNGGVPGAFTQRYREAWSSAVNPAALKFELKAGTSAAEMAPGSAYWDNFHAAVNYR